MSTETSFDEEQNQKTALRALSRDTWTVCDDLRPDPASEDEIVALFAAAIVRAKSCHQAQRLYEKACRIAYE